MIILSTASWRFGPQCPFTFLWFPANLVTWGAATPCAQMGGHHTIAGGGRTGGAPPRGGGADRSSPPAHLAEGGVRNGQPCGPRTAPESRQDVAGGMQPAAGAGPREGCWPDAVPHTPAAGPEAPPPVSEVPLGRPVWVSSPLLLTKAGNFKAALCCKRECEIWGTRGQNWEPRDQRPETLISFPITAPSWRPCAPPAVTGGVGIPQGQSPSSHFPSPGFGLPCQPQTQGWAWEGTPGPERGIRGVLRPPVQGCVALPSPRRRAEPPGLALSLDSGQLPRFSGRAEWSRAASACACLSYRPVPK